MAQSPPSAPLATALTLALALACTATAHAQRSLCEPTALAPLASTIAARDLGLPALRERGDRCVRVTVRPVELGPPLVARLDGSRCAVVALAYRRTTVRSEVCGNDVHFEPEHETGVAVFARAGGGWRRIARGALTMPSLDLLAATEYEGRTFLALGARRLVLDRRRVIFAP